METGLAGDKNSAIGIMKELTSCSVPVDQFNTIWLKSAGEDKYKLFVHTSDYDF